jgi:hypothetical protein
MWQRSILTGLGCSLLFAQDPASSNHPGDGMELLGRIKVHMQQVLRHEPNYTCLETMERTRRVGLARQFQMQDTLRLEVALVEGREMFAWPGSKQFESDDLRSMISSGTYGNGSFALFARAVFLSSSPTFDYRGQEQRYGKTLERFDFRVTRLASGYSIRIEDREAVVGYRGSFWADPQSLDTTRLEVIADDIPPELNLASARDRIDYARVQIGPEDFLLPSESELAMIHPDGEESRNYTRFTNCRQYSGESVLRFDEVTDGVDAQKPPDEEIVIPAGLELRIALADDIDVMTAAAGDELHGTLAGDLKLKGKVLAAKGAVLQGRITRIERYGELTAVGITFTDLYSEGRHAALTPQMEKMLTAMLFTPTPGKPYPIVQEKPHEGLIRLRSGRVVLRRGILMYWRT